MGYIWTISLFTYLLDTTSVSGRVPGYPSYYPTSTRVINYPDTAALHMCTNHGPKSWCISLARTSPVRLAI